MGARPWCTCHVEQHELGIMSVGGARCQKFVRNGHSWNEAFRTIAMIPAYVLDSSYVRTKALDAVIHGRMRLFDDKHSSEFPSSSYRKDYSNRKHTQRQTPDTFRLIAKIEPFILQNLSINLWPPLAEQAHALSNSYVTIS